MKHFSPLCESFFREVFHLLWNGGSIDVKVEDEDATLSLLVSEVEVEVEMCMFARVQRMC